MSNPFEDLRQAVVVRTMNSPGPQGAAAPHMKIRYSADSVSWHNDPVETDKYLSFSTDNGITWSDAIYFNNLSETLDWVEKARQWAENPENDEVEPGQYSALHHALQAKKAEITAGEYAIDAAGSATEAFGAAAPAWDSATVYNYNDVVSFDNGHTYRCIGTDIIGVDHAPNIDGVDNAIDWTRITVSPDGYFEVDEDGNLMPMITPITSEIFMLDENGDIMYQENIDLEPVPSDYDYSKIEFVDSIAYLRNNSILQTKDYVYVAGYYGAGTPGGGMFYRDLESTEVDNGGTVIVDGNGIRWKRANVHEEYYASWFGVSTDIDDNSPLIQNALNIIPSGSVLIFGPGIYKCQQTITIPDSLNYITIKGSSYLPGNVFGYVTRLQYTGPNPATLTPFIDFRGSTGNRRFLGSIRNMMFYGLGSDSNIVGLWFYDCAGSLFDSVHVEKFKYGIQIDDDYYYCKFNDVLCAYCDYGLRANGIGNGAVFNYCNFKTSNVGFGYNLNGGFCIGIYLNNCYFEGNKTAIKSNIRISLHIHKCYFESNSEYIIDNFYSYVTTSPLLVLKDSYMFLKPDDLVSDKAAIKQTMPQGYHISYVISDNIINTIETVVPNYFIYVASGDLKIKAENNIFASSYTFPISSKTPIETSYFNNDFNE